MYYMYVKECGSQTPVFFCSSVTLPDLTIEWRKEESQCDRNTVEKDSGQTGQCTERQTDCHGVANVH